MRHTRCWSTYSLRSFLLGAVLLQTLSCSRAGAGANAAVAPAASSPAASSSEGAPNPEPTDSAPATPGSSASSGTVVPSAPAPAGPTPIQQVESVCEAICARTDKVCSRMSRLCRASCEDYVQGAARCPVEIHEALSCQQHADDFLICSSVSPEECAQQVLAMQDCRTGKVPPAEWGTVREQAKEQSIEVPSEWQRLHHPSGFSIAFPPGAAWDSSSGTELALAKTETIEYRAHRVGLSGKKLTDGLILRTASQEVGRDCEAKLKLFGRYETGDTVHIRFQTTCKGDEDKYGVLHIRGDHALFVYMHRSGKFDAPPQHLDALVFGYSEP